eukprot:TRINITY_DN87525_c0_g1_i1.p1 TRINITY_DN87525_c0_g1~~TRINITY_DN87525_c0_g1_i1.p1  ORF type:complete len:569 (+),score=87.64 TRINITY_DN87525_c0_g1_i1:62-1768(+)
MLLLLQLSSICYTVVAATSEVDALEAHGKQAVCQSKPSYLSLRWQGTGLPTSAASALEMRSLLQVQTADGVSKIPGSSDEFLPPMSFIFQILNFGVAWAAAWKIGAMFPRYFHLPMLVGYMLVGVTCGSYMTGMLSPDTIDDSEFSVASLVENATIAFIAMSAGSEINLRRLGLENLQKIGTQIAMISLLMFSVGTSLFLFLSRTHILPSTLLGEPAHCRLSAAWLIAVIQTAGSVIEVLAIYHETKGFGPVTSLMIGTTMLLDMFVVTAFALAQPVVVSQCSAQGVGLLPQEVAISIMGQFVLWIVVGGLLACVLQVYMMLPGPDFIKTALIVITGWFCHFELQKINHEIASWSPSLKLVSIDPLLVCMIAASFLQHLSSHGEDFRKILDMVAPLVMPPFFTVIGAKLNIGTIASHASAIPPVFLTRFVLIAAGSFVATLITKESLAVRNYTWMTLQSQSGVTLALLISMTSGMVGKLPWASDVRGIIAGCVVANQLVGPALCRFAIRTAGESQEEDHAKPNMCDAATNTAESDGRLPVPKLSETAKTRLATSLTLRDAESVIRRKR